jgi:hypothetical protein
MIDLILTLIIDLNTKLHIVFSCPEKKAYGTKAEAGKGATLVCAIVGSPVKPTEIHWIDGDNSKVIYKSSS